MDCLKNHAVDESNCLVPLLILQLRTVSSINAPSVYIHHGILVMASYYCLARPPGLQFEGDGRGSEGCTRKECQLVLTWCRGGLW